MNTLARNALIGYGAFCAINWAVTYSAARSGSPLLFGSASLLSLNESLRPLNLLAYLVNPINFAQQQGASPAAPSPAGATQFLPGSQAVTNYQSGTTTQFQP